MKKVFCIGFHKTGTNSLGEALTILGYKVCGVQHDLPASILRGDDTLLHELVSAYDAFKDNPWPVLFEKLDDLFPGSKFILSVRDEKKWIESIVNHFDSRPSDMIQFIYGKPFPKGHEELFLQVFRKHEKDVLEYFSGRPKDLLIINLEKENTWDRLCNFLHAPVPEMPFPHLNKGAYTRFDKLKKNLLKRIRGRLRSFRNPDTR